MKFRSLLTVSMAVSICVAVSVAVSLLISVSASHGNLSAHYTVVNATTVSELSLEC